MSLGDLNKLFDTFNAQLDTRYKSGEPVTHSIPNPGYVTQHLIERGSQMWNGGRPRLIDTPYNASIHLMPGLYAVRSVAFEYRYDQAGDAIFAGVDTAAGQYAVRLSYIEANNQMCDAFGVAGQYLNIERI